MSSDHANVCHSFLGTGDYQFDIGLIRVTVLENLIAPRRQKYSLCCFEPCSLGAQHREIVFPKGPPVSHIVHSINMIAMASITPYHKIGQLKNNNFLATLSEWLS